MPATPIVELITQNILSALQGVTTGNGYNYTITPERELRRGNKIVDCKVVIFQGNPQLDQDSPLMKTQWIQPYYLEIFVQISDDQVATLPPSQKLNLITGDILAQLFKDIYRGGNAIDTVVDPWEEFQAIDGTYDGRRLTVNVKYRHIWNDTSQQ